MDECLFSALFLKMYVCSLFRDGDGLHLMTCKTCAVCIEFLVTDLIADGISAWQSDVHRLIHCCFCGGGQGRGGAGAVTNYFF